MRCGVRVGAVPSYPPAGPSSSPLPESVTNPQAIAPSHFSHNQVDDRLATLAESTPAQPQPVQRELHRDLWPGRRGRSILLPIVTACLGSGAAIPGIFQAEIPAIGVLAAIISAPIIEEAFKPAGAYLMLIRWPVALKNQPFTALLCGLAGITFGLVESLGYVTIYVSDPTPEFVAFRFTVPVAMHGLASFVFGWGLNQRFIESFKKGGPFHVSNWGFFVAAIVLHGVYNLTVTILQVMETI